MLCEWDDAKNDANYRKHGVDFHFAVDVFRGPTLEREDDRRDYGETRIKCLGVVDGIVLKVIYTPRGDAIRLISAWRAGRRDRNDYHAHFAQRPEPT